MEQCKIGEHEVGVLDFNDTSKKRRRRRSSTRICDEDPTLSSEFSSMAKVSVSGLSLRFIRFSEARPNRGARRGTRHQEAVQQASDCAQGPVEQGTTGRRRAKGRAARASGREIPGPAEFAVDPGLLSGKRGLHLQRHSEQASRTAEAGPRQCEYASNPTYSSFLQFELPIDVWLLLLTKAEPGSTPKRAKTTGPSHAFFKDEANSEYDKRICFVLEQMVLSTVLNHPSDDMIKRIFTLIEM